MITTSPSLPTCVPACIRANFRMLMPKPAAASSARFRAPSPAPSHSPLRCGKVRAVWVAALSLVFGLLLAPVLGIAADSKVETDVKTESKKETETEAQSMYKSLTALSKKWAEAHPEQHVKMAVTTSGQTQTYEMMQTQEGDVRKSYIVASMNVTPELKLNFFIRGDVGDVQKNNYVAYFPLTQTTVNLLDGAQLHSLLSLLPSNVGVDPLEGLDAIWDKTLTVKNETGYRLSLEFDMGKFKRSGLFDTQRVSVAKMTLAYQYSDTGRVDNMEREIEFTKENEKAKSSKVTTTLEYITFDPQKVRNEIKRFPKFGEPDKSMTLQEAFSKELEATLGTNDSKSGA